MARLQRWAGAGSTRHEVADEGALPPESCMTGFRLRLNLKLNPPLNTVAPAHHLYQHTLGSWHSTLSLSVFTPTRTCLNLLLRPAYPKSIAPID